MAVRHEYIPLIKYQLVHNLFCYYVAIDTFLNLLCRTLFTLQTLQLSTFTTILAQYHSHLHKIAMFWSSCLNYEYTYSAIQIIYKCVINNAMNTNIITSCILYSTFVYEQYYNCHLLYMFTSFNSQASDHLQSWLWILIETCCLSVFGYDLLRLFLSREVK